MGHVPSFGIILITLLSMQFANGQLKCFVFKYAPCYPTFVTAASTLKECKADETVKCIKESANECGLKNSTEVDDLVQVLEDTCQTGTDMNKAFLKHMDCLFGKKLADANAPCYVELIEAVSKYKRTGNADKDQDAVFKISCKYIDSIKTCVDGKVKDACGEEAQSYQRKLSSPAQKLEKEACNSSPASFVSFWTLLLQATVILLSLEYFRLTK